MLCEKCKQKEGVECVFYSYHEGYLCRSCYKKWLKIDRNIPVNNNNYKPHEKKYLEWIQKDKKNEMLYL